MCENRTGCWLCCTAGEQKDQHVENLSEQIQNEIQSRASKQLSDLSRRAEEVKVQT